MITPRGWQAEAVLAVATLAAKLVGRTPAMRVLVTAWMGSGKTELAFLLGQALGRRVLFLVNSDVLADQTEKRAAKVFSSVGRVQSRRHEPGATFVVASLQTLADPDRLASLVASETHYGPFDLIVADEAHGYFKNSTGSRVLEAFPTRPALGLTATPWRLDGGDLAETFVDGFAFRYGRARAEADGHVVPLTDGEGSHGEPRRILVPGLDRAAAIAAAKAGDAEAERKALGSHIWPLAGKEAARAAQLGYTSLVAFTPDVESAHLVAEEARKHGVTAEAVDGKMSKRKFDGIMARHKSGEVSLAASCMKFTVGWDGPYVLGGLWIRATQSLSLYWQGVGRIIRADPSNPKKKHAYLVDFVGAFDAHRDTEADTVYNGNAGEETKAPVESLGDGTGDKPTEEMDRKAAMWRALIATISGSRVLASPSGDRRIGWLAVKDDQTYAFGGADGSTYTLESAGQGLWYAIREPKGRGARAVRLCKPTSREEAQGVAERAAAAGEGIDNREAAWREKEASQTALDALARLRVKVDGALKAGEASDLLTIAMSRIKKRDRYERGISAGGASAFE